MAKTTDARTGLRKAQCMNWHIACAVCGQLRFMT